MPYLHVYTNIVNIEEYDDIKEDLHNMSELCQEVRHLANSFDYIYIATHSEMDAEEEVFNSNDHVLSIGVTLDVKDKEVKLVTEEGQTASILMTDSQCTFFIVEEVRNIILSDIVRMLQTDELP